MTKIFNNQDFFRAVEEKTSRSMRLAERSMHRVPEMLLKVLGMKPGDYKLEGHYGLKQIEGHEELARYFLASKTLQDPKQFTEEKAKKLHNNNLGKMLHDFYQQPVFGLKQGMRDAFNERDVFDPEHKPQLIATRADALSLAMHNYDDITLITIPLIMQRAKKIGAGDGLVSFGLCIDNDYNPIASTLAAEANVLYRMKTTSRGLSEKGQWAIDDDVFDYGNKVIDAYNSLFNQFAELIGEEIQAQHFQKGNTATIETLLNQARSPVRCVNLHTVNDGIDKFEYHWATFEGDNGLHAYEFFSPEIVTTAEIQQLKGMHPNAKSYSHTDNSYPANATIEVKDGEIVVFSVKTGKLWKRQAGDKR